MKTEIEARFLEINKDSLVTSLRSLKAKDKGESLLTEIIFYDSRHTWPDQSKFVRVRSTNDKTMVTFKHNKAQKIDSAKEIEFLVPSIDIAKEFLENIDLVAYRHQEKKRHSFQIDQVSIDIDTWPHVPPYVEIEGPSKSAIKKIAEKLNLDWSSAVFDDARGIIQDHYNIPLMKLHWFTFKKFE